MKTRFTNTLIRVCLTKWHKPGQSVVWDLLFKKPQRNAKYCFALICATLHQGGTHGVANRHSHTITHGFWYKSLSTKSRRQEFVTLWGKLIVTEMFSAQINQDVAPVQKHKSEANRCKVLLNYLLSSMLEE